MVRHLHDYNGFEVWRKLEARYGKTKVHSALLEFAIIANVRSNNDIEFDNEFIQWELDVAKFEKAMGALLPDTIKVGLVLCATTGKLYDHLCFNVTETRLQARA